MKTYKVNEIFYSIQGEAFRTGEPSIFVRFSKCNLKCEFCDTDFADFTEMTAQEIVEACRGYNCKSIIFTGGEPALQVDNELIDAFHERQYFLTIETNGTRKINPRIDWITVSPKPGGKLKQLQGDELKLVNWGHFSDEQLREFQKYEFRHFYLQPMDCGVDREATRENIAQTVGAVKRNPRWKLSAQVHKYIGVE